MPADDDEVLARLDPDTFAGGRAGSDTPVAPRQRAFRSVRG
jgi:hypothetical protein